LAVALLMAGAGGCGPLVFVVGVSPGRQDLEPTVVWSDEGLPDGRVALVDVSGLIVNARRDGVLRRGENPVSLLHEQLRAAERHGVDAVVLRVNSPGGAVTASEMMHAEIVRFRQRTGRPVVVAMMDVAASGGYYLACAGDVLMAHPTTVTGSIGVLVQTISFKPALDRIGIETETIRSGANKAAGSPLTRLTDEQRAVFQDMVDRYHRRFVAVVRRSRADLPEQTLTAVADGRVITGEEAAELGLVDGLGDVYDAVERAKQEAGIASAQVVRFHRPLSHVASPYAALPGESDAADTEINLLQLDLGGGEGLPGVPGSSTGFYYLWQPAVP
jgi:protease-4